MAEPFNPERDYSLKKIYFTVPGELYNYLRDNGLFKNIDQTIIYLLVKHIQEKEAQNKKIDDDFER